jgi:hypothetical protein
MNLLDVALDLVSQGIPSVDCGRMARTGCEGSEHAA